MKNLTSAFRLFCRIERESQDNSTDEHPPIEKRINKIILVNPQIRSQMGCPEKHSEYAYCNSEKTSIDSPDEKQGSAIKSTPSIKPSKGIR